MHVLYVHQNFPAQFGHIARHLIHKFAWRCTFISQTPAGTVDGIEKITYKLAGGATQHNHYCSRTFENCVWHSDAVYQALRQRPDIRPDLIVGHSGFGSTLFLRELYPQTPILNMFEFYYRSHDPDSDMDFRHDLGWEVPEQNYLRSRCRNAMILLDLQNCDRGYIPTQFQKSRFPAEYLPKMDVIFDGVDRGIYHGHHDQFRPPAARRAQRTIAGVDVPPEVRVVTYVSRGFESMRGFDIFMRSAKLIARRCPNVLFFVVGSERICYGGDENYIKGYASFKEWVLSREEFDLSRFVFVERLPQIELARLLACSDLHVYLTVPFVLSWSMMDAMSCGAVVLASRTSPVQEMIRDGENGLLADFFSPEDFADKAVRVLEKPDDFRPLGKAAERMIVEQYSLEVVLPRMLAAYESAMAAKKSEAPAVPQARGPVLVQSVKMDRKSPFLG
ncbi:MAG: glycosyltransferase [Tepidisphaerales bacterium]